ncbi:MAG: molybdopterin molybdotransferase MoeA [Solirubrobacteraceae bacterium]
MRPALLSIEHARRLVLARSGRLGTEQLAVGLAYRRVLAAPVLAGSDVPPFPGSAMDGFAVIAGPRGRQLDVVGESRAGVPFAGTLGQGQAVRISTGATLPDGADAVIRQEDCESDGATVELLTEVFPGNNVRRPGEDMRAGSTVLAPGVLLRAGELAAAVAAGAGQLCVSLRPRVSVLCTGDELRAPGERLGPGEIHNSNGPMLTALATRCGALAAEPQRIGDDREATKHALSAALADADVVVLSGGVSVGPHDHVKPALAALGVREHFWGVSLQPGKPTWFGSIADTLVFGLPGNPVSSAVTFALFARPALAALQGQSSRDDQPRSARLGTPVPANPSRTQAIRVRLELRDGLLTAFPNGAQGSHVITSLLGADALALIPPGVDTLDTGSWIELEPLPL